MTLLRVLLFAILIVPLLASSEVYKWTDAQGRIHYSDSPPPEAKAKQVKIKVSSIQGPAVVSALSDAPAAKSKEKVRIYTTPWCGYCKKAKAHLAGKGVLYEEVDVEASEQGMARDCSCRYEQSARL